MATVEQTMMKVQRILTGPLNLRIQLEGEAIRVTFSDVSTYLHLRVVDWGKDKDGEPRTLVSISAPVLRAVPASPAIYEWVAREASQHWFGHMQVYDDKQEAGKLIIIMAHTLLGDYLDEQELASAMFAVLGSADHWDDEIQKRFGGKRMADK